MLGQIVGHMDAGNRDDEEVIGKHGFGTRNTEDRRLWNLPTAPIWQYSTPFTKRERSIRSHTAVEVGAHKLTISYAGGEIWGS